jgi:predicted Zn-dependent protease with MMP-like domain
VDREDFERLVEEALDSLPDEFLEAMENVYVQVEEWPSREELAVVGLDPRDRYSLLGLYHGVPLTNRGTSYVALPDRISIYQRPIEAAAGPDDDAIRAQVQRTVIHEIAHHYGIDDDRLEELDSY